MERKVYNVSLLPSTLDDDLKKCWNSCQASSIILYWCERFRNSDFSELINVIFYMTLIKLAWSIIEGKIINIEGFTLSTIWAMVCKI